MKGLAVALLLLAGCGLQPRYEWSSLAGRDCFWSCQNIVNTCSARCVGPSLGVNLICAGFCNRQGQDCASSCPDLVRVQ